LNNYPRGLPAHFSSRFARFLDQRLLFSPASDIVKIDNFCDLLQEFAINFAAFSRLKMMEVSRILFPSE